MHRAILNELRLEWTIIPTTPLLVSANDSGQFVRFAHPKSGTPTAYLPGGTLKGLLRSAGEGIMLGATIHCCEPQVSCYEKPDVKQAANGAEVYKAVCSACRIFGNRALSSHITLSDAYPPEPLNDLIMHDLIDDKVCESIAGDAFHGVLTLRNFERWQLGFLGVVFGHISAGHVALGAHRNLGMGRILIQFSSATISYFGFYPDTTWRHMADHVHGVGSLASNEVDYGFIKPDLSDERDLPRGVHFESGFGFAQLRMEGRPRAMHPMIEEVLYRQLPAWERYIQAHRAGS